MKARIMVNAWAFGREPKQWEDSETFIPEILCPSMSFGLTNIEPPLATFVYFFDWTLPDGMKPEEVAMTETLGVTIRRKDDLMAIPIAKMHLPIN